MGSHPNPQPMSALPEPSRKHALKRLPFLLFNARSVHLPRGIKENIQPLNVLAVHGTGLGQDLLKASPTEKDDCEDKKRHAFHGVALGVAVNVRSLFLNPAGQALLAENGLNFTPDF
jgi:hypothetical protein